MKVAVATGLILFGLALFAMSFAWASIFSGASKWTPEKEKRTTEIKARLYDLSFIVNAPRPKLHSGQDIGQLKAEYEQLKKESEQLNEEFLSARDTPQTTSKYLKWTGISLAAVGIVGWYAVKQQD
jgi:hypothetical protein